MNAKLFSDAFDVLRTKTSNQLVKFSGMGKKGLIKGKKRGAEKRKKNLSLLSEVRARKKIWSYVLA